MLPSKSSQICNFTPSYSHSPYSVVVASGLIALVDDCIKRHFHSKSKRTHQVSLPLTPLKMDMEFVGPRAMVEHMFKRRNTGSSIKEKEQTGSPLKFTSPVAAY
jgi:hypothetical protein